MGQPNADGRPPPVGVNFAAVHAVRYMYRVVGVLFALAPDPRSWWGYRGVNVLAPADPWVRLNARGRVLEIPEASLDAGWDQTRDALSSSRRRCGAQTCDASSFDLKVRRWRGLVGRHLPETETESRRGARCDQAQQARVCVVLLQMHDLALRPSFRATLPPPPRAVASCTSSPPCAWGLLRGAGGGISDVQGLGLLLGHLRPITVQPFIHLSAHLPPYACSVSPNETLTVGSTPHTATIRRASGVAPLTRTRAKPAGRATETFHHNS